MAKKLRVIIAQLNLLVGDLEGNLQKHILASEKARDFYKADLIIFPELSLTGYPPEDLLLRKGFIEKAHQTFLQLKDSVKEIYCLVGHPLTTEQGVLNACSMIYNGTVLGRYAKQYLPNYEVFDEYRYFIPGSAACVLPVKGIPLGIVICEDLWQSGPVQQAAMQGARLILSPNASPYESDKHERRLATLAKRAKANRIPIIYVNQVGGQDELVFDGGSMVVDDNGNLRQVAGFFSEVLHPVDFEINSAEIRLSALPFSIPNSLERDYKTLVLGLRDYVNKNGFPGVIIGVSGGVDSALTLAIAVDALGRERVSGVFLPTRYTSDLSRQEAEKITENLGVSMETIDIEPLFKSFLSSLAPAFAGKSADVTEENLQSRCRGVLLMALSNKRGGLVLTTGNRSELAVGYATIYGDMAGGFAPLKDVPKTRVYELAKYRNELSPVIPESTLKRAPTAELAPNQKDEDSLPPYSLLDGFLKLYLDQEKSPEEIIALGFEAGLVNKMVRLIARNEYKRRQAPLGTRLNLKSFGKDRRYPITSGFKG